MSGAAASRPAGDALQPWPRPPVCRSLSFALSQAAPDLLTHFLTQEIELTPRPAVGIPQARAAVRPLQRAELPLRPDSAAPSLEVLRSSLEASDSKGKINLVKKPACSSAPLELFSELVLSPKYFLEALKKSRDHLTSPQNDP